MKKVKIEIEGMHCSSCASNVEKSLLKIPGIKNPKISLLLNKGSAEAEDNVSEEEIKYAVKKAGYNIKKISFDKL